jgi:CheY-like chemotaxis protein
MSGQSVDVDPHVILVAEHHPQGLKTIRVTLEKAGYTVLEARTGHEILELMAHGPDLIIQDLALPGVDGFELVRRIRSHPQGADIPVIAYAGLLTRLEEARCIEVGFTDYLFKPTAPVHLLDTVEAYLPESDHPRRDGERQRLLVVDDDPTHLSLIRTRLERAGFFVTPISDASQALVNARRFPPDLILSDVLMPKMDGFQFCLAVRRHAELAHVPVLLYSSAYVEDVDRQLAREAGATDLLLKSPGFDSIIAAIEAALGTTPPRATALSPGLSEAYTRRLSQQLDGQMALTRNVRQRLMQREAELAILSSFLDALMRGSTDEILEEMLGRVMHAAGVPEGIIYLTEPNDTLVPRVHLGYPGDQGLADYFGHLHLLKQAITRKTPAAVPSLSRPLSPRAKAKRLQQSVLIVPIVRGETCVGVLVLSSSTRVFSEEMLPFAKTVGTQIGQTLGMVSVLAMAKRDATLPA